MKQKNFETLLYSTVGVLAVGVLLIAVYIISSAFKVRVDITEDKAHTLSPGTLHILNKLDSQVTIRFYCTQGDNAMPPALRVYAQHIEDLLTEYKQTAKGKIIIEKLDPKPDSEAEDSARLNGVEGRATGPYGLNKIYLGLVISIFDEKFTLPFLQPDRERLLEYDISRAISRVENPKPPVIGIMSAFGVFGQQYNPLTATREERGIDPWVFVTELRKDFNVKKVPMSATNIDDDIQVLIVMHPRNITDQSQYAIDQFVMRGGKLLAFLDPHAYFDESHDMQNQKFNVVGDLSYGQSTLDKLLPTWGLSMDVDRVVADTTFGSRNSKTGDMMPTMLTVTRSGIDQNDVVTSQIDNLFIPFAGAFTGKPAAGLKETVLVKCTPNSQLVDSLASVAGESILREFKAENIPYAVAVDLTGKFKSAFPNGMPQGKTPTEVPKNPNQLMESKGSAEVILVCDTDMLNDRACVQVVQTSPGHRSIRPMNGNLNFVQSAVEQLSGDDDLISARSRASMNHPFTRLRDMQAAAGKQSEEKLRLLETKLRDTKRKISELETHKESGGQEQELILSPEQQKERDDYLKSAAEVNKELKQVRRDLNRETESLEFRTKLLNIGAMPAVVAALGLMLAFIKPRRKPAK